MFLPFYRNTAYFFVPIAESSDFFCKDRYFRETKDMVKYRLEEGCSVVEMDKQSACRYLTEKQDILNYEKGDVK